MLVEDLMTREVEACRPGQSLAEAAGRMWRRDCGAVPVVDEGGALVGIITDRDICMALASRRAYASEVTIGEVMSRDLVTCTPEDDAEEALEAMRRRQVRRLPVVDAHGRLAGIISVADVLRRTRKGGGRRWVKRGEALSALKGISRPHGAADGGPKEAAAPEVGATADEAPAPERETAGAQEPTAGER